MRGAGWSYSPFDRNASYWRLDKPVIIGELPGVGEAGYRTLTQMYRWALDSSYAGIMAWTYAGNDANGSWTDIRPGVQAVAPSVSMVPGGKGERQMRILKSFDPGAGSWYRLDGRRNPAHVGWLPTTGVAIRRSE